MKKAIAILMLLMITATTFSQTRFGRGIKLYNASEVTDFSGGFEHIPVMKTNGFINRYIHSDSLALKSDLKLNLQQVLDNGNTTYSSINFQVASPIGSVLNNAGLRVYNQSANNEVLFGAGYLDFRKINDSNSIRLSFNPMGIGSSGIQNLFLPYKTGTIATIDDIPNYTAGTNINIDNTDPQNPIINGLGSLWTAGTETNAIRQSVNNTASGLRSLATGFGTSATGGYSTAMGHQVYAPSYGEVTVGLNGTIYTPSLATNYSSNDRIFSVGNGSSSSNRSDALIVQKNGRITAPSYDISEIDNAKSLITKEYADANYSGGSGGNFVTIDTDQTITGTKTFDASTTFTKNIQSSGLITASSNISAGGRLNTFGNAVDFQQSGNSGSSTITANISGSTIHTLPPKTGTIAHTSDIPQYQAGSNITIDNTDPSQPIINATSSGGGATNLSYTASATQGEIVSSTGTNAVIPLADATNAGLQKANFYEEGSFTVTLTHSFSGATFTIGSQTCSYVRVGNMVYVDIRLFNINTTGTPNANSVIRLSGVPFPASTEYATTPITLMTGLDRPEKDFSFVVQSFNWFLIVGTTIADLNNVSGDLKGASINNGRIFLKGAFKTNVYTP